MLDYMTLDFTLAGFLIATLFAVAAFAAIIVLMDSCIRGVSAYRNLSSQASFGAHHNSVMIRVEQFERSLAQPSFRMRSVNRSAGSHQMARRRALPLCVAA